MAQILSFRRGRQSHREKGSDQKQDGNSVKQILKAVLPWLTAVHMILRYGLRRLAGAAPPFSWRSPQISFFSWLHLLSAEFLGRQSRFPIFPGVFQCRLSFDLVHRRLLEAPGRLWFCHGPPKRPESLSKLHWKPLWTHDSRILHPGETRIKWGNAISGADFSSSRLSLELTTAPSKCPDS